MPALIAVTIRARLAVQELSSSRLACYWLVLQCCDDPICIPE